MSTLPSVFNQEGSERDDGANQPAESPMDYEGRLGLYAPWDWSDQPFVECNEHQKGIFKTLVSNASRADIASRYLEVSQTWEARWFDRGYQHLEPRSGGGFSLPGANTVWGPMAVADASGVYPMNVYGRDKDIIVGALVREIPKVRFFPNDISSAEDISTAEAANRYKMLYERNARLRHVMMLMGQYYYTDDRICLYTRHVLNAPEYGLGADGTPAGSEETEVFGKLEHKVPMQCQDQRHMNFIQVYWDEDETFAKAKFPWIRNRIQSSVHGMGELGFDKVARMSTRQGLYGRIVSGDTIARVATIQYTWFRPMMWYDKDVSDKDAANESGMTDQDWLFKNFPDGALVAYVGQEFAFARNERVDDHVNVSHAYDGIGQNRRALGSSNIPVQKRLNNFLDLLDDFARRTIPRTWYDAEVYSLEAINEQDNVPGRGSPVQRPPNAPLSDTMVVEQVPQAQPFLFQMAQWYFQEIPASLTGAVPTLYGADAEGEQPTSLVIQRDAAFGRIGTTWNNAKEAFCRAFEHAVKAAAARGVAISGVGPDGQHISIDASKLTGNVYAYAEYDAALPETWNQRETRYTELWQTAATNPVSAAMLKSPRNMRAIADNIRVAELEIPGESSSRKQLDEIERMKKGNGPLPNPQYVKLETALQTLPEMGAPPDAIAQASTMLSQIPPEVSSVPVAQDASENHEVEAQTCFEWMNGEEGIKYRNGLGPEQRVFEDIYLHWQAHTDMMAKLQKPGGQKPPSVSINFKDMPPDAKVQALKEAGIDVTTDQVQTGEMLDTHRKIAEKVVPKTVPDAITVRHIQRS